MSAMAFAAVANSYMMLARSSDRSDVGFHEGASSEITTPMRTIESFAAIVAQHAPGDGVWECALPGVKLIRSAAPTIPMPVVYEPTVCFVAQGRKQAMLGDRAFVYDNARYLVSTVGLAVVGSVIEASQDQPYLSIQIDLDTAELGELMVGNPREPRDCATARTGLTLGQTSPVLLDAVVRLVGLLDTPDDIDTLAPLVMREIMYRLLAGPDHHVIRSMTEADSRLTQIARAIAWIRTNYRAPFAIEDVAGVAQMSESSFYSHFKSITAMTPLEFRTHLRLQEARRLMVSEAMDAASVAFEVGYASPSQFSRDYSRFFGAPPATHAARLRAGDGAAQTISS